MMAQNHTELIRRTFEIAADARSGGNHPFGALLASPEGEILLESENTVVTEKDCTGHAETNLMRLASKHYTPDFLSVCTLYTSTEPCAMCAGAIFWGNVRRVVFGLRESSLYKLVPQHSEEVLQLPVRSLFQNGRKHIEVIGPVLEEEARQVHAGFWSGG